MSWRDRLRKASFRGVPFFVGDAETSGGRKTVRHDYLLQDIPFMEDLGRQARGFSVSGYLLGPDYDLQWDALERALETAGPGQLVHPYRGTLMVSLAGGYNVRYSQQEGGICFFRLNFVEAGEQQFPAAAIDREFTIRAAAEALVGAAEQAASAGLVLERVAEFVRAAATGEVQALGEMLLKLTFPGAAGDVVAAYSRTVGLLVGGSDTLIARVVSAVRAVRAMGDGDTAVANLQIVRGFAEAHEPGSTPSRAAATANRKAVGDLIRACAAAEQAQALLGVRFDTYEQAVAARDDMAGFLDQLAETAGDGVYLSLQALRAEVVAAIPGEAEDLPRLARVTLGEAVPALMLAYDLYEDVARAGDIVARNRVRHPGFVPGGVALEVLTA